MVAQLLPPRLLAKVWRLPARLAVDLYNPTVVEVLEAARGHSAARARERRRRVATRAAAAHLAAADFVICASEQQRDLWLGGMALRELLAPEDLDADPDLSRFLAVVPFGVPAAPPAAGPGLRAALPAIGASDRVLLWGGGIWDWLDAPTAIRAAALLADRDRRCTSSSAASGGRRSRRGTSTARPREALALARELGLEGRRVHFHDGWVPVRGARARGCSMPISACPPTPRTWSRASPSARGSSTTSGPGCRSWPRAATRSATLVARARRWAARSRPAIRAAFAAACAELLDDAGAARARAAVARGRGRAALGPRRGAAARRSACAAPSARRRPRAARVMRRGTLGQYPGDRRRDAAHRRPWPLARQLGRNLAGGAARVTAARSRGPAAVRAVPAHAPRPA